MRKIYFKSFYLLFLLLFTSASFAQIYEPEGLNMPGAWNAWTNPPTDNLAFASSTQVTDGRVVKFVNGITRWQTIFHVAASGADVAGGSYEWLFTSGPDANPFANKWASVDVTIDQLQQYTKEGADNNTITLVNDRWYTMVWEDNNYTDCRAIFMETSAEPVEITTVSEPVDVAENEVVDITFSTNAVPSAEEVFYLQYSTDDWATAVLLPANMAGTSGSASIPGQVESTVVEYNVFSSTVSGLTDEGPLYAIFMNDNTEQNYTYDVGTPLPDTIGWANLQWPATGEIETEAEYIVYGQVYINNMTQQDDPLPDLDAWVGYSTNNTNPDTWTDWIPASYFGGSGNNDEYTADLGSFMDEAGTFYYATRFKYQDQDYVYGGYSESGGDFWDGVDYISGVLTVTGDPLPDTIGWANLQWPENGEIEPETEFIIYGQAWIDGITSQDDPLDDLQAWVGYSSTNTNPESWTNWVLASYSSADGDNDEYSLDLGSMMDEEGVFYYATRFQYLDQDFVYGGYSTNGGGFWDGVDNVNGLLNVTSIPAPDTIAWANLQWPANGTIEPEEEFNVFGQVWIEDVTGSGTATADLEAWIGFSETDTDPATWTDWVVANYEGVNASNDEFKADIGTGMTTEGTYYYATRFKYPNQEFVYGGYSTNGGGFWDGVDNRSGILTVSEGLVSYPIEFTVTDATTYYANIKLKGDMTDWNAVDMAQDGQEWSVTLDMFPGTYEWGVFEDDGSPDGIWLIIGDNLVVTVDTEGNVSGQNTYVITLVGLNELSNDISVYPNPVQDILSIEKGTENSIEIQILDVTGNLLETIHSSSKKIQLDMAHLSSGLYFLKFEENGQSQMIKFIKQ
jgi:hypothetical protein